jgi:hypothetical protein
MTKQVKKSSIGTIVGRIMLLLPAAAALCLTILIYGAHNLALNSRQLFAWTLLFGIPWNTFFNALLGHVHVHTRWVDNSISIFALVWGPAIMHTLLLWTVMRVARSLRRRSRASAP